MRTDADERQEYATLRLEGFPENQARQMARSANDKINQKRLSGPIAHGREGHGQRPMISDLQGEQWYTTVPVTLDTRTDEEREDDYRMADKVRTLLQHCTPLQQQVLTELYGLDTGTPLSYAEVGRIHGRNAQWASNRRRQALATIRRTVENPPLTATQRAERKREQKRLQHQRAKARRQGNMVTNVTNVSFVGS